MPERLSEGAQTPVDREPGVASGRVRHEEKITVYVSVEELIALEQARLRLKAEFGIGVDRGRIVRAAIAGLIDDLAANGPSADVLSRLGK